MKKSIYLILLIALLAGVLASCAAKPGDALITVKGKITKTNASDILCTGSGSI